MTFNEIKFRQSIEEGDMQTTIQQLRMLEAVGGTFQLSDLQVFIKQEFEVSFTRTRRVHQKAVTKFLANSQEEAEAIVQNMEIGHLNWEDPEDTQDYDMNVCIGPVVLVPNASRPSNEILLSGQGRVE